MLAGVALGWLNPRLGADMKPLGDGFIALVRMIIGPVIFCTVVNGVGAANDFKKVGRVALKALVYFEVVTLIALVFALVGVNLWGPGVGMNVDLKTVDAHSVAEYAARYVKKAVVGTGAADKTQIAFMVARLLPSSGAPTADAADALAVAITHAGARRSAALRSVA